MKLKVQIVEDDANCVGVLESYLVKFKEAEIIGITSSILDSYNFYLEHKPDILILEIELGDDNIFTFIDLINTKVPIIFTTGHPEYAIKALKIGAIDYLVKPISEIELNKAFYNAIAKAKEQQANTNELLQQKISVESNSKIDFIPLAEIVYLEASGNYTKIHLADKSVLLSSHTLKYFTEHLPSNLFIRINHGFLINTYHLKTIEKSSDLNAILTGNIKIPISYRKKSDVFHQLSKAILIY